MSTKTWPQWAKKRYTIWFGEFDVKWESIWGKIAVLNRTNVDEVIKDLADLIESSLSLQADCFKYSDFKKSTDYKLYSFFQKNFHRTYLSPGNISLIKDDLDSYLKTLKELKNVIQYVKDLIYTTTTVQTGNINTYNWKHKYMEKVGKVLSFEHFGLFPKSVQEKIDNLHIQGVYLKNEERTGVSARYKAYNTKVYNTTLKRVRMVKNPGNKNNPGNILLALPNNSRTPQKIKQKVREI